MKKFILFFFIPALSLFANQISNPALDALVYKIRDPNTNREEFRENLQRIGEYLGFEIARDLHTSKESIMTVMEEMADHNIIDENIVLVTILRAGLPLFDGLYKIFPHAEAGFFAMQRNEETLKADIDYVALPPMEGKTVIIADTMIATGGSILDAIKIIEKRNPAKIIVVGAIAANFGIDRILEYNDQIEIYPAAIDPVLNDVGYIVPGLGDAGDRCYGLK